MRKLQVTLSTFLLLVIALIVPMHALAKQPYTETHNIRYSTSQQLLDLCRPKAPVKKTALIFIHGGGFRSGSKEQMQGYCRLFAQGGFVSVTINYRLSPANKFPAALEDTQQAIRWLSQRADEYGHDPSKIVVVGYSAGGNLALMAGLAEGSGVAGIVSGAGPTDLRSLLAGTPHKQLKIDLNNYLGGESPDAASPIFRTSTDDPPVFLLHGDKDPLVPVSQALGLAQKLREKQVPVLLRIFTGAGHEIMLPNKYSHQLLQEMTRFFLSVEQAGRRI